MNCFSVLGNTAGEGHDSKVSSNRRSGDPALEHKPHTIFQNAVEHDKFRLGKTGEYLAMTFGTLTALQRREFLKLVGSAAVCGLADPAGAQTSGRITLIVDSENATAS